MMALVILVAPLNVVILIIRSAAVQTPELATSIFMQKRKMEAVIIVV
jgi:hypothetical protein